MRLGLRRKKALETSLGRRIEKDAAFVQLRLL